MRVSQRLAPRPSRGFKKASRVVTAALVLFVGKERRCCTKWQQASYGMLLADFQEGKDGRCS